MNQNKLEYSTNYLYTCRKLCTKTLQKIIKGSNHSATIVSMAKRLGLDEIKTQIISALWYIQAIFNVIYEDAYVAIKQKFKVRIKFVGIITSFFYGYRVIFLM